MDTPATDKFMSECHYNGKDCEDNFNASIEYGRKLERLLRRLQPFVNEAFIGTPEHANGTRFDVAKELNDLLRQ